MAAKRGYYFPWKGLLAAVIMWFLLLVELTVIEMSLAAMNTRSWAAVVFGLTALLFVTFAIGWCVVFHSVPIMLRVFTDYHVIWRESRNAQKSGPRSVRPGQ